MAEHKMLYPEDIRECHELPKNVGSVILRAPQAPDATDEKPNELSDTVECIIRGQGGHPSQPDSSKV